MGFKTLSFVENLDLGQSLLFVGPPDTGKSSRLKSLPVYQNALYVDLDDELLVRELLNKPDFLKQILNDVNPNEWLTILRIDRIHKYWPELVEAIKSKKIFIAGTLSSLKSIPKEYIEYFDIHQMTNLSYVQVNTTTSLNDLLSFGSLPKVYNTDKEQDKVRYLKNYVQDFLNLEIISNSLVRNLVPFHLFLPLAAHQSGQKINFTSLAQDLNVDYKSVQHYYDLLIQFGFGFYLPAYGQTIRNAQSQASKFYFFDCGVQRAFGGSLDLSLQENSPEYESLFKSWCIQETVKVIHKQNLKLKLSQIESKDGAVVDLIIENSKNEITLVVFKNTKKVLPKHIRQLNSWGKSFKDAKQICVVPVKNLSQSTDKVLILSYQEFLSSLV